MSKPKIFRYLAFVIALFLLEACKDDQREILRENSIIGLSRASITSDDLKSPSALLLKDIYTKLKNQTDFSIHRSDFEEKFGNFKSHMSRLHEVSETRYIVVIPTILESIVTGVLIYEADYNHWHMSFVSATESYKIISNRDFHNIDQDLILSLLQLRETLLVYFGISNEGINAWFKEYSNWAGGNSSRGYHYWIQTVNKGPNIDDWEVVATRVERDCSGGSGSVGGFSGHISVGEPGGGPNPSGGAGPGRDENP